MDHILDFTAFIKKQERSCRKDPGPAPEDPAHRIFVIKMEMSLRQVIKTGIAEDLFMFP